MEKPRVMIFDFLRILAITIIVCYHSVGAFTHKNPIFTLPIIGEATLGTIGIALFVFISGAVLEISYRSKPNDYISFIKARLIRIYPAFWGSLLILMVIVPLQHTLRNVLIEFTGMGGFALNIIYMINGVGWFIGLIFVYYLIFPFITEWMERYSLQIISMSVILTVLGFEVQDQLSKVFPYVLPGPIFQYFAAFIIGIYIVKSDWYPKKQSSKYISLLAEFSFYIFLINAQIIYYYAPNPIFALSLTVTLSVILMIIDIRIQELLKKIRQYNLKNT